MAPIQVTLLNVGLVHSHLQNHSQKKTKPNYKLGDYVQLSLMRRMFMKMYMSNFTEEVFFFSEVLLRDPPVYNKTNNLILNLTPETVTQHSRIE